MLLLLSTSRFQIVNPEDQFQVGLRDQLFLKLGGGGASDQGGIHNTFYDCLTIKIDVWGP
jgi:hypothetical protein